MKIKTFTFWRSTEWFGMGIYAYLDDIAYYHAYWCIQISIGFWHVTLRPHAMTSTTGGGR